MNLNHIFLFQLSPGWTQAIQFFIALSILIVIHEFGHFFFARLFKTRVEKFYLFFDFLFPFPGLANFALFKKKIGDTEYGLGWFPLGGYVKIAGMIDESTDKEALKGEPQPWEYRSKKAYQRLFIMIGGVMFNVILALCIYTFAFGKYGESKLPLANAKYGFYCDSLAKSIGFEDGDMLLKVANTVPDDTRKIFLTAFLKEAKTFTVLRNGQEKIINIPKGTIGAIIKSKKTDMLSARFPFMIDSIGETSVNKGILKQGDQILSINGKGNGFFHEAYIPFVKEVIDSNGKAKTQDIQITVLRNNDTIPLQAHCTKDGQLEVVTTISNYLQFDTTNYSFFGSIGRSVSYTYETIRDYLIQLRLLFTSSEVKISESVGGFYSIGKIFPESFNLRSFLMLTALISLVLAVMNLLPIPGLDGGYVLFLIWELVTGKKVSDNVIEKANGVGLVILLALMIYVNGLDVFRAFFK